MFYFNNYSETGFKYKDSDRFSITYTDMDGKSQTLTNQKYIWIMQILKIL